MKRHIQFLSLITTVAVIAVLPGCSSDGGGTPPPSPTPTTIDPVGNTNLQGTVGMQIASPLQVRVRDQDGAPMSGVSVAWAVSSGGGSMSVASSTTDANGIAEASWTLGPNTGAQMATATVGSLTVTFNATAEPGAPSTISVAPPQSTLTAIDATVQLVPTLFDAQSNPISGASFQYSSDNQGVATVSAGGLVTAVANGVATITVSSDGVDQTVVITVQQVAATLSLDPLQSNLNVGLNLQLVATVRDSNNNDIPVPAITWDSSDDGVATVTQTGLVNAVAEGMATITATSGTAFGNSEITVVMPLPPFNPQADENVDGTIDASEVMIPQGVTITATDDLIINASGDVQIDGTLTGDCVSITINGNDNTTINGTVSNNCTVDPGGDGQNLRIVGNGVLDIEDADIISSGNVEIQNDPTLTDGDFDDIALRLATFDGSGSTHQGQACNVRGGTFTPNPPNAPPDPMTGMPADGRTWTLRCRGNLNLGGNPNQGNKPTVISGQNGQNGTGALANTTATGTDGTNAGKLRIFSTGNIVFGGNGGTTIRLGDGGNGGGAIANGVATGGSATATGGNGGEPGGLNVRARGGITIGAGTLTIEAGNGGDGGDAFATGADGADAGANPPEPGGNATALGGDGGNSLDAQLKAVGNIAGAGFITLTGGDGGKGGSADADAGDGGDGNAMFVNGADGGLMHVVAGDGGDAQGAGLTGAPFGTGGMGGDTSIMGGVGGTGWDDCVFPNFVPGGMGGRGGDATGFTGIGGAGGATEGMDGGFAIAPGTGDGGDGGHGFGPGMGGPGGMDLVVNFGGAPNPNGPAFRDGLDGLPCEKKTFDILLAVDDDPQTHEQYITLIPQVQGFMMWINEEGDVYIDDGNGPLPLMTGGFDQDGLFIAMGVGPVTADIGMGPQIIPNIGFEIIAELDPLTMFLDGFLTVGGGGNLPGGAATRYSVVGIPIM